MIRARLACEQNARRQDLAYIDTSQSTTQSPGAVYNSFEGTVLRVSCVSYPSDPRRASVPLVAHLAASYSIVLRCASLTRRVVHRAHKIRSQQTGGEHRRLLVARKCMRTARVALLVVSVMAALEPEDVLGDGSVLKTIVRAGSGGKPRPGQIARLKYALRLADETVIEEDAARSITVGNEGDGLDLGVAEMRVGERSRLEVRFDRGFGEAGLGRRRVPPRATLFYDVELLAVADDVSSSNDDPLALPASDGAQSVTVGGEAVAMEELGPIVINTDGTTARITNWPEMTPAEQEKTRRVIVARNAKRLAKLEAAREL